MYCRIIPLEMDGGDHVMLIILPTSVTDGLCTDEGAECIKIKETKCNDSTNNTKYIHPYNTNLHEVNFYLSLVSFQLEVQMYHSHLIHIL